MESNPFPDLKIEPPFFLDNIEGRSICKVCGKSRKYYCYTCYVPLGGEEFESKVPKVKLPVKIDVIKHPQEVDGKSTAVHAAILAHEDVKVYTYPAIPEYPDKSKVILVYPGNDSVTFEEYVRSTCPLLAKDMCSQPESTQKKENKSEELTSENRTSGEKNDSNVNNVTAPVKDTNRHETAVNISATPSTHENNTEQSPINKSPKYESNDSCLKRTLDPSTDNTLLNDDDKNKDDVKRLKLSGPKYKCMFEKVVFIDSTWHSVHKISIDERLKGIQRIELKSQTTKFWRHQADKPETYLATVEAMYYFLREYHDKFSTTEYNGDFDNLLFYFVFMYDKIRHMYEGGKYLKAYNEKKKKP